MQACPGIWGPASGSGGMRRGAARGMAPRGAVMGTTIDRSWWSQGFSRWSLDAPWLSHLPRSWPSSGLAAARARAALSPRPPALGRAPGEPAGLDLPGAAAETLQTALGMIEHLTGRVRPLDAEPRRFARAHPACRALMAQDGVAEPISRVLLAELGDTRRFSSSRHAVRFAGLDVTVYASDGRRSPGRLSRQGSPLLRWAAYEAAHTASRTGIARSPLVRDPRAAPGQGPGQAGPGAQDRAQRPPHPARARRRRHGRSRCRLTRRPACAPCPASA